MTVVHASKVYKLLLLKTYHAPLKYMYERFIKQVSSTTSGIFVKRLSFSNSIKRELHNIFISLMPVKRLVLYFIENRIGDKYQYIIEYPFHYQLNGNIHNVLKHVITYNLLKLCVLFKFINLTCKMFNDKCIAHYWNYRVSPLITCCRCPAA